MRSLTVWVNGDSFTNLPQQCINTVSFQRVVTARMRITRFEMTGAGQLSNPNFREIEIFRASTAPNDAGVIGTDSVQAVCPGTFPVNVTIQNFGTNRVDSVLVNWSIDGVAKTPVWYTTQLDTIGGTGVSSAQVALGNHTFTTNTIYILKAWTSLPNSVNDTSNFNDTLTTGIALGAPTGFAVGNVTSNSATLSWNAFPSTNYRIVYGFTGFNPLTGGFTANATGSPHVLTGLIPNTGYDAYLLADCGGSVFGDTTGPVSFLTPCVPFVAPYNESFDGSTWVVGTSSGSGDAIDPCWSRDPALFSAHKWSVYNLTTGSSSTGPATDHSGTGNYLFTETSYTNTGPSGFAELYTPLIITSSLTAPYLNFWYHRYGATMGDLYVEVNDGTSGWTNVLTLTGEDQTATTDPWKETGVELVGFGDTIQVRFLGQRLTSFTSDMAIDDFSIQEAPPCPSIGGLDTILVTDTSAILTWGASSKSTLYQVWYGPQGFFQGSGSTGAIRVLSSNDTLTLQQLNSQFCYEYVVRSICQPGDTSGWAGPFSFCTKLGYDAELVALLVPDGCGSASSDVSAVIRNNGDNPISNIPISLTLTGTINTTYNATYTNTLNTGDMDTVIMGNINTLNGALISYMGYVNLSTDQISSNDTIIRDSVYSLPLDPLAYDTTFCVNQDTAVLLALPAPGVGYNWFGNATDTVPLFSGNPYKVPTATAQSTYYVEYANDAGSLTTTFAGGNGQAGNAFDLLPAKNLDITGFDVHIGTTTANTVNVYYRMGPYSGFHTALAGWTLHESINVVGAGVGNPTPCMFTNPVSITSGQVWSFMVVCTVSADIDYTNGTTTGAVYAQNADLTFYEGAGVSWPLGSNFEPRIFNGNIHYGTAGCSNVRKLVNLTIGADTSTAAFTTTGTGLTRTFDASASVNADHYAWDFGDGNNGVGVNPSHTYASNGNYTVTLTVSDSTDCYSTSIADTTLMLHIGLDENPLAQSLRIYPNPSEGIFNISFDRPGDGEALIEVIDASGKTLYTRQLSGLRDNYEGMVDLREYSSGVYVISIRSEQGVVRRRLTIL